MTTFERKLISVDHLYPGDMVVEVHNTNNREAWISEGGLVLWITPGGFDDNEVASAMLLINGDTRPFRLPLYLGDELEVLR